MSISYMNYMAQKMSPKEFEKWQEDFCATEKVKEYFVINNMGACDSKGYITTIPHLYTKEGAELASETLADYTGHAHYVVKVKPESATKEFCRDTYGTIGSYVFKADAVARAMNLSIRETYEWLYNAVHYGFLTQWREDTFIWKGEKV